MLWFIGLLLSMVGGYILGYNSDRIGWTLLGIIVLQLGTFLGTISTILNH